MGASWLINSIPWLGYSPELGSGERGPAVLEEGLLKLSRLPENLMKSSTPWVHEIFSFLPGRKYELVERWRVEILGGFWNPKTEYHFLKKKSFILKSFQTYRKIAGIVQRTHTSIQIPQLLTLCHNCLIILIVTLSLCMYRYIDICFFLNHLKVSCTQCFINTPTPPLNTSMLISSMQGYSLT